MDPTEKIRAAPEMVKAEYVACATDLIKNPGNNREERKAIFQAHRSKFSQHTRKHLKETILEREDVHFDFMNSIWGKIYQMQFGVKLPSDYPTHDWSKDDLFAFTLAMQFDILKEATTDEEKSIKSQVARLARYEVDRHYTLEPHHPEYEEKTGKECSETHILEMAVDRLARNVQFNEGKVDMDKMIKFMPKFHLGDIAKKNSLYLSFVERYAQDVSRFAIDMYFKKPIVCEAMDNIVYLGDIKHSSLDVRGL